MFLKVVRIIQIAQLCTNLSNPVAWLCIEFEKPFLKFLGTEPRDLNFLPNSMELVYFYQVVHNNSATATNQVSLINSNVRKLKQQEIKKIIKFEEICKTI